MSQEPGKLIGTKLSFQMNHASTYGILMAPFALDTMLVNAAFQNAFIPFEKYSGRTPGIIIWDAISYHGLSNSQRIEGNLNSNRYVREVQQPEVGSFLQGIPGAISRIMPVETSVQPNISNFIIGLLIHRICQLLST